jgi:hypothetical protein
MVGGFAASRAYAGVYGRYARPQSSISYLSNVRDAMAENVAARIHPSLNEFVEEYADKRETTKARVIEEQLRKLKEQEEGEQRERAGNGLPEGVYRPEGEHDFAVKFRENGRTRRKYYKTREGALNRAESEDTLRV